MVGKILRIIPDLNDKKDSSKVSENGRYRIPNDNPFAAKAGARGEIWAYGLRNPARLTWDFDPANPRDNHLIASVIGLYTWETVVIIHKGANYGYSLREGNQKLETTNKTGDLPEDDKIPVANRRDVDRRHGDSYVSSDSVRARQGRRRRCVERLCLSRQGHSGSAGQIHFRRYFNRQSLVCRLQRDAGSRRRRSENAGRDAPGEDSLGQAGRRQRSIWLHGSHHRIGVSCSRRQGRGSAGYRQSCRRRPLRYPFLGRFGRRTLHPE